MRKRKSSKASSERQNWEKIFNSLVQMLRSQQNQLQSLANERKFLQDRFQTMHEAWASDIRVHEDQISEMKGNLIFKEKKRLLEAAKADLVLGSKNRETSFFKWVLEHTEDELADFKAWFEYLSCNSANGEDPSLVVKDTDKMKKGTADRTKNSIGNNSEEEKCSTKFEHELRSLRECEKLALEKSSEVSALLAEKNFVWNQYNIMESNFSNKLRTKQAEVEKAKERIQILVSSVEQLQSANNEKDNRISELESKVAYMEADTKRLNEEISRLSVELESLRKSKNNQVTPVLKHCTEGTKTSGSVVVRNSKSRSNNITSKKLICTHDSHASSKVSEKGNRSLKRKDGPALPLSESPKLFSSNFKVPKLKSSLRDR